MITPISSFGYDNDHVGWMSWGIIPTGIDGVLSDLSFWIEELLSHRAVYTA
jgi:hypothetical protein